MLQKIKEFIASTNGIGYANAAQIWRGYGDNGQRPYGYWLKPFGEVARWIGSSLNEIKLLW